VSKLSVSIAIYNQCWQSTATEAAHHSIDNSVYCDMGKWGGGKVRGIVRGMFEGKLFGAETFGGNVWGKCTGENSQGDLRVLYREGMYERELWGMRERVRLGKCPELRIPRRITCLYV